jgi:predicted DNA-binding ribbon-helix-helix protein
VTTLPTLEKLADDVLLAETIRLAARERLATGQLIAALAEVDARKLYLGEGCSSLFVYCTRVLQLSEHAAYSRIEAARIARRFPIVLDFLVEGTITLTTITLLAPHLTEENCRTCSRLHVSRASAKSRSRSPRSAHYQQSRH